MYALFLARACAAWLFGACLVLAGFLPVLYALALFAWQYSTRLQEGSWVSLPASLWFADHSLLQSAKVAPILQYVPQLPFAWLTELQSWPLVQKAVTSFLDRLHAGLVPAIAGIAIMAAGVATAARQKALLAMAKRGRENRKRRVRQYRADSARPQSARPQSAPTQRERKRSERKQSRQKQGERVEPFIGPGIGPDASVREPTPGGRASCQRM
jgi:hypothetical protein